MLLAPLGLKGHAPCSLIAPNRGLNIFYWDIKNKNVHYKNQTCGEGFPRGKKYAGGNSKNILGGSHIWAEPREKVPNVLSRCAWLRPPLFWYMTPTFYIFYIFYFFIFYFLKSRCHTKRKAGAVMRARPSFGMTMTQAIRDLFA